MNNHRARFLLFLVFELVHLIFKPHRTDFFSPKVRSPLTATTLESYLYTIRKYFMDLYGRPKKCKEIWDLRLSRQNFPVHLLVYKTSFIFCKKPLISHCQIAWLQTNTVPVQLSITETAASRFPVAQPHGSEWAAPLLNQYGLGERRSIRGEKSKNCFRRNFTWSSLSGYSPVSQLRKGRQSEGTWPCKPMRTNPACGSPGQQEPSQDEERLPH